MTRMPALAALVLAAAGLAGCAEGDSLFDPTRQEAYRFDGDYTWTEPFAVDGHGNVLDEHALHGDATPYGIEQVVSGHAADPEGHDPASGAEASIGILDDGTMFVNGLDLLWRSPDGGRTWDVAHNFEGPFAPFVADQWGTADPMLHVDPETERLFLLHMYPGTTCLYLATSDDRGETWTDDGPVAVAPGFGSCGQLPYDDHPKIVTAPLGPDTPPGIMTQGYPRIVVVCANKVVPTPAGAIVLGTWCMTSYDGGRTFAHEVEAVPPEPNCAGINGPISVGIDGTLLVPVGGLAGVASDCPRPPGVAVSRDNGLTWEVRWMPGDHLNAGIDPDISVTPDGTAYLVYTAQDSHTYLTRSRDDFATWDGPWLLSPPGAVIDVFGVIVGGDDGRIAVAFLSTPTEQEDLGIPVDSSEARPGTMWHLWVATSVDAGSEAPTFLLQQVTPREDPVQVGCVWLRGGTGGPQGCRNLLDFMDMALTPDGRYVVAFTDGCVPRNGCTADPENSNFQSRDTTVAVAVQDRGTSLYAANGVLPSLGLVAPPYPYPEATGGSPPEGGA